MSTTTRGLLIAALVVPLLIIVLVLSYLVRAPAVREAKKAESIAAVAATPRGPAVETLLEEALRRCEVAGPAGTADRLGGGPPPPLEPGSIEEASALVAVRRKGGGTRIASGLPFLRAEAAGDVRVLVCVEETSEEVGRYEGKGSMLPMGSARVKVWDVHAVTWVDGRTLGTARFVGGPPPREVTSVTGMTAEGEGGEPLKPLHRWLAAGIARARFFSTGRRVSSVVVSPDGSLAAIGTFQGAIEVRRTGSWEVVFTDRDFRGPDGEPLEEGTGVHSLSFSADGRLLASGNRDGTIDVWDVASSSRVRGWKAHDDSPVSVDFAPHGHTLASAGDDAQGRTVKLWNAGDGREVPGPARRFGARLHIGLMHDVAFSPDGRFVASASADGRTKIWNIEDRGESDELPVRGGAWNAIAWAPNGDLAAANRDGRLALWTPGAFTARQWPADQDGVQALAFSADGRLLGSGDLEGVIRLWDPRTRRQVRTLRGHGDAVHGLAFTRDGRTLVSGSLDGTVRRWDLGAR